MERRRAHAVEGILPAAKPIGHTLCLILLSSFSLLELDLCLTRTLGRFTRGGVTVLALLVQM